jgi:hypothetical protein
MGGGEGREEGGRGEKDLANKNAKMKKREKVLEKKGLQPLLCIHARQEQIPQS